MEKKKSTKFLIPTLKPNQFNPIPITGYWEYLIEKKQYICHNATPHSYSEMEISETALVDSVLVGR